MTKREESKNEALDRPQEEFIKAVGERIRQTRARAGLTQAELATNAGVNPLLSKEIGASGLRIGESSSATKPYGDAEEIL